MGGWAELFWLFFSCSHRRTSTGEVSFSIRSHVIRVSNHMQNKKKRIAELSVDITVPPIMEEISVVEQITPHERGHERIAEQCGLQKHTRNELRSRMWISQ